MAALVTIQALGYCTFKGTRGEAGGAPSKDSLWGVAFIGASLVKFYGRRNGTMRFKTVKKAELPEALTQFQEKQTGFPFGKKIDARYTDVTANHGDYIPDLAALASSYYAAVKAKKVNTRATVKQVKEAA
jgi:hypothetical protein